MSSLFFGFSQKYEFSVLVMTLFNQAVFDFNTVTCKRVFAKPLLSALPLASPILGRGLMF
jgi:hypothetical protein